MTMHQTITSLNPPSHVGLQCRPIEAVVEVILSARVDLLVALSPLSPCAFTVATALKNALCQ
jgi:hypothetical protein